MHCCGGYISKKQLFSIEIHKIGKIFPQEFVVVVTQDEKKAIHPAYTSNSSADTHVAKVLGVSTPAPAFIWYDEKITPFRLFF